MLLRSTTEQFKAPRDIVVQPQPDRSTAQHTGRHHAGQGPTTPQRRLDHQNQHKKRGPDNAENDCYLVADVPEGHVPRFRATNKRSLALVVAKSRKWSEH